METPIGVSRRDFLGLVEAAGALILGIRIVEPVRAWAHSEPAAAGKFSPNVWLSIAPSGETTIWLAKAEMGQGVYTALPMLVAEELDADWNTVRVVQADTVPQFAELLGTGGSSSVRTSWKPLRQAGAAARAMLVAAAAAQWKVPATECETEPGSVIHRPTNRRAPYGTLVEAASHLEVPTTPALKNQTQFRLIGNRVQRLDTPAKVNGSAIFGADVRVPGLLFAVIQRCPVYGGKIVSIDDSRAKAVAGVRRIIPLRDIGIAVVADTSWAALQGRRVLQLRCDGGAPGQIDSAAIAHTLDEYSDRPGVPDSDDGDVVGALQKADRCFAATYRLPFVAHEPMEPSNCTAHVRDDSCEIWAPVQSSDTVQKEAAKITQLPLSAIRVHTTFLGGGFGRKWPIGLDFPSEAVLISQAIRGPVQLLWSREDDLARDLFRPPSRHVMSAGFDADGHLTAWRHRIVTGSIRAQYEDGRNDEDIRRGLDKWATDAPGQLGYRPPHFRVEFVMTPMPVRIGAWRSVYASQTAFADECFVDELAVAMGKDPYLFRVELLQGKSPRHLAVLERVAREAGWGKELPSGRARGIAVHKYSEDNETYVAQVAEVSVEANAQVHVHRVVCAVECGTVVNPGIVEAQMEGAILYGLSAALSGEITFDKGRGRQTNFHDAPLLRFREAPQVEVHILESDRPPTGVGEPGVPPIAPAVANAVSAAIKRRVRELPLTPARLRACLEQNA